jgi:hypothetical protein
MKKNVIALTFDELTVAGEQAAAAAIAESHAAGLATWGTDEFGRVIETRPGGDVVIHAKDGVERLQQPARPAKRTRRSVAA